MTNPIKQNHPAIRCLLGMLGTDVHNQGIRVLAQILRDNGMEVIYVGEHNSCEGMVQALIAEDADIVGISFSSSNYLDYMAEFVATMKANGVEDVPVMVGGIIHQEDHAELNTMGVEGIFGPGSQTQEIINFVQQAARKKL